MKYTRTMFAQELKQKIFKKQSVIDIGVWAHSTYLAHIEDIDLDFGEVLLTLNTMELGPEFAFSYAMLDKISDDLIAGKKVDLTTSEYREPN